MDPLVLIYNKLMLSSLLKITADLFEIVGKFGGAERCWCKISSLNSNAENLTAAGYICFKNKNFQDAENYFLKAIKKSPKYFQAFFNLGFLKQKEKSHVDAIHYFSKAIELNGKCDVAYYGRAQSFLATDLLDKAILDLQQTIELQPFGPHAYYKLSHIYAKLNKREKALEIVQKLVGFEPQLARQLKRELNLEY